MRWCGPPPRGVTRIWARIPNMVATSAPTRRRWEDSVRRTNKMTDRIIAEKNKMKTAASFALATGVQMSGVASPTIQVTMDCPSRIARRTLQSWTAIGPRNATNPARIGPDDRNGRRPSESEEPALVQVDQFVDKLKNRRGRAPPRKPNS